MPGPVNLFSILPPSGALWGATDVGFAQLQRVFSRNIKQQEQDEMTIYLHHQSTDDSRMVEADSCKLGLNGFSGLEWEIPAKANFFTKSPKPEYLFNP